MNEQVTVLQLIPDGAGGWAWAEAKKAWAKVKRDNQQNRMNLFSRVGLGAKTELFTMRQGKHLTLHNALRWRGKHYFITEIREPDRMFRTVVTAQIEPYTCTLEKTKETVDSLKRPVEVALPPVRFPACVTEKYLGFEQGKPMAVTKMTYVLVTPKVVELHSGDLVRVALEPEEMAAGEIPAYVVTTCHVLDEFKNEYEIVCKKDV